MNAAFASEKRASVRVRGAAFEGERGRILFLEREADGELAGTVALLGDWFDGRPVGIQVVGKPRGEAGLLSAGLVFEDILGIRDQVPIDPRTH